MTSATFALAALAIGLCALLRDPKHRPVREPQIRLFLTAGLLFAALAVAFVGIVP